jgi:signal transduction histidine kinase
MLYQTDHGAIVIEVRDDGPGLSDDLKREACEPLFKADSARTVGGNGGLGLGLSITSGIARSHAGNLR